MAKTCLNKISGNILQDCTIAPVGVKEIYLMHVEDVTLKFDAGVLALSSVVFAEGAKSHKVEGYKQNIQVTSSLRSLDASTKLDISVSFKMYHNRRDDWRAMLAGRFYVMAVYNDTTSPPVLIGGISPLEVTASDFDSNAGAGLVTFTLGAPEGSAGGYFTTVTNGARDTIISKSV